MRTLLTAALLASLVTTSTGCFTAAGALVGSSARRTAERNHEVRVARGEAYGPYMGNEMRNAVLVGLAIDALAFMALSGSKPLSFGGVPDTYPEGNAGR